MDNKRNINKLTFLIIEDEQDICFMLIKILKQKSYTLAAVHNITEASRWLLNQSPALIFLDNNLPDGRGIDFLPLLKKMNPSAKIIMITAYDTPYDKRLAIENGVDEFIGKPFTRQAIYSVVDKLLN